MPEPRIYPLGHPLTGEQIAVTFALCSRSPDPFDVSAQQVTAHRAAEFHRRWVLDYGHASVAEHAVAHIAIENISRRCADRIERGRLSSYTEQSSRYQVIHHWRTPAELETIPDLQARYRSVMTQLFQSYHDLVDGLAEANHAAMPKRPGESPESWLSRRRRASLDAARGLLPAATLTSLGITVNARSLAYLISRLLSTPTHEEQQVGFMLKKQGEQAFPTLLRHAAPTPALQRQQSIPHAPTLVPREPGVALLHHDPDAPQRVARDIAFRTQRVPGQDPTHFINQETQDLGDHDPLPREFELPQYHFEITLDYGALRELRRHRMMTLIETPLTTHQAYVTPDEVAASGYHRQYELALTSAAELHQALIDAGLPEVAQYAVCHAHLQTARLQVNLRQLRHLARLRTSPKAHPSVRHPVAQMLEHVRQVHPQLYHAVIAPVT